MLVKLVCSCWVYIWGLFVYRGNESRFPVIRYNTRIRRAFEYFRKNWFNFMVQFLKKFGGDFIWTRGFNGVKIFQEIFYACNSDRDIWHLLNVFGM